MCGTVHKVTIFSIIVNGVIFLIPFVYLSVEKKLLLAIIWILIFNFVVQPFVLQYKEKL